VSRIELRVDSPADGGAVVGRYDGRVVFARHSLPGERVRADVTAHAARFWRADALEVLEASPHRVDPVCPWYRPGGCGGCGWLHADPAFQLTLKAEVLQQTLRRIGGIEWPVVVRSIGPAAGWRTRVTLAVDQAGRAGLHPVASHDIVPIEDCLQVAPELDLPDLLRREWTPGGRVHVAWSDAGRSVQDGDQREGPEEHVHSVSGRRFMRPAEGFWQSHRDGAQALVTAVLGLAGPASSITDLYAGVGLFGLTLRDAFPGARVTPVEGDPNAARWARRNAAGAARVLALDVRRWRARPCDLLVLDPPRAGAGPQVVAQIAAADPASVVYVSCDPATLARDLRTFAQHGYRPDHIEGFDLFPGTSHIETVVRLVR
jgi:tRNA/tmRNA/rRNA uracil-C5-methylase (TrmA/RlmC/RlmD family)